MASLLLLSPLVVAGTEVPGFVSGRGKASAFYYENDGPGHTVRGGAYEYATACGDCFARFAIYESSFMLMQDGVATPLPPGNYEFREFRGLILRSQEAPYQHFVDLHGAARVVRLA